MRKLGFTLAEVLITLVIIGVIAAMTVPTLMNNTNAQEYRTGLKKAVSTLNQAISMNFALDGLTVGDYSGIGSHSFDYAEDADYDLVPGLFMRKLSINDSTDALSWSSVTRDKSCSNANSVFSTNDGMKFCIESFTPTDCDNFNTQVCGQILVDVNGDRKPNKQTTSASNPRDIYVLNLYSQKVTPGDQAAQDVMFDKEARATGSGAGS